MCYYFFSVLCYCCAYFAFLVLSVCLAMYIYSTSLPTLLKAFNYFVSDAMSRAFYANLSFSTCTCSVFSTFNDVCVHYSTVVLSSALCA